MGTLNLQQSGKHRFGTLSPEREFQMIKAVLAAYILLCLPAFANNKPKPFEDSKADSSAPSVFGKAMDLANMCRYDAGAGYSFCQGYVFGEAQTFELVQNFVGGNLKPLLAKSVCIPDGATSYEMVLVFRQYIRNHPEALRKDASFVVYLALAAAYPCNKVSKSR